MLIIIRWLIDCLLDTTNRIIIIIKTMMAVENRAEGEGQEIIIIIGA